MTKIVQTFWNAAKSDILLNTGGYACPEIHCMSWAFSCLQLRKFYPDVEMYTDQAGKELFELLGLPYTKIHTALENDAFMQQCLPELWAYAKIHTYSLQNEPFLHIDGDVFIWKAFDEKLLNSPLIAQNVEDNLPIYAETLKIIEQYADYLPDWFHLAKAHPKAHNAGIFGGTNTEFFKKYAELAQEFYWKNRDKLAAMNKKSKCVNLVIEQYLFYVLSQQQNIPVSVFDEKDICEQKEYQRFCEISKIPYEYTYLHTLGEFKKSNIINNFISFALKEEYPEYWYRIIDIFRERNMLSPYLKHQFEMQDEKTKDIMPLVPEPTKDYETIKKLCGFLEISYDEWENKKANNPIVMDFFKYNELSISFSKRQYSKFLIKPQPFSLYSVENPFTKNDFLNSYIFVNPYLEIVSSKYHWNKIFAERIRMKLEDIYPERYILALYTDPHFFSFNQIDLNDFALHIIETIRPYPITIKDLIVKQRIDNKYFENFLQVIKSLISYGLLYISKTRNDFIAQETSDIYSIAQQNYKTQISLCLNQILEHYNIGAQENIHLYDNSEANISLIELIKMLEVIHFEAKAVKGTLDSLDKIPLPAIALIKIRSFFTMYAVIKSVNAKSITIFNPEINDNEQYSKLKFTEIWDGTLILLLPKSTT